jgi:DEAD/DEAH box helicase domain-containing protein
MHHDLLARTRELITTCPCENGCPSCVGPVGQSGPLAKIVAVRLLDHLTGRALDALQTSPQPAVDDVPF